MTLEAFFGFLRAQVLEHMEETQAALDLMLPLVVKPGYASQLRAPMLAFSAQLAAELGDAPGAVALAEQAVRLAEPDDPGALEAEVRAHIAAGDGARAVPAAAKLLRMNPDNQRFIAMQATAWRLAGMRATRRCMITRT